MTDIDWHKIKFLESSGNIRPLIKLRLGRVPSSTVAREITVCIQQGRLFYEAAAKAPLEIRPLQLFYGMVGFAKALILARDSRSLTTLKHSHGITDISDEKCKLSDLKIKIGSSGTFQEFNDTVSDLNRICYFGKSHSPCAQYLPTAKSNQINGVEISLKETLSRIPDLEDLFKSTFNEYPNTEIIDLNFRAEDNDRCEIRIDDPQIFKNREELIEIVNRWRHRFPFLKQWQIHSATHCWGNSIIEFENIIPQENEFSPELFTAENFSFSRPSRDGARVDFKSILAPLAGGYSHPPRAISPFNGLILSEFSLHYLALFLLSSLVRYRPQTWGHSISRSVTAELPADDEILALLEKFMGLNQTLIPQLVSAALNPREDKYAQQADQADGK